MKCFAVLLCLVWACQAKNMTRVLLTDAASSKGAVCLDGSPSGYFIRNGTGMNKDKWIVHQMGGGWCFNETDCYNRSKTYLGSSKPYPDSLGFGGFLSDNRDVNPDFYDWNIVFIIYCDGASFAGFMEEPIKVMNTSIYFRGFNILKAVLDDLLEKGMRNASEVILTGCSAGGLATYIHADFVQSYLPSGIKFRAFADAGYFLDIPDVQGIRQFYEGMSGVFKLQNVSGGLNQDCIKAMSAEDKWKCLFAPYSFTYIKSRMFVLNSLYDTAQLAGILQLPCLPPNCSKNEMKFFFKFEEEFMSQAKPILESKSTGLFLDSCLIHCQTLTDEPWDKYGVGGQTMRETFADWYFDRPSGKGREVDCGKWPCNPTCPGKLKHPLHKVFSGFEGGETLF